MTVDEIREKLNAAISGKNYPMWAEVIASAVITGAFTLFFGGGYWEALVSLLVGIAVYFTTYLAGKLTTSKMFNNFLGAAFATLLAHLSVKAGWIPSVDMVVIGNIMPLIPGIGLTNAVRDLFTGDSIAGLLRLVDALLTALAIAAGYYLIAVFGGFLV